MVFTRTYGIRATCTIGSYWHNNKVLDMTRWIIFVLFTRLHTPFFSPPRGAHASLSVCRHFIMTGGTSLKVVPKSPNQSLQDVKIHVWKWSWALNISLNAVLG